MINAKQEFLDHIKERCVGGKTPISLWKGTSVNQMLIKLYLVQYVMK